MKRTGIALAVGGLLGAMGLVSATAQQPSEDRLETLQLRPNVYVVAGAGANIVVHVGATGAIVVDSGTARAAGRTLAAIQAITKQSQAIRYIINTSADP